MEAEGCLWLGQFLLGGQAGAGPVRSEAGRVRGAEVPVSGAGKCGPGGFAGRSPCRGGAAVHQRRKRTLRAHRRQPHLEAADRTWSGRARRRYGRRAMEPRAARLAGRGLRRARIRSEGSHRADHDLTRLPGARLRPQSEGRRRICFPRPCRTPDHRGAVHGRAQLDHRSMARPGYFGSQAGPAFPRVALRFEPSHARPRPTHPRSGFHAAGNRGDHAPSARAGQRRDADALSAARIEEDDRRASARARQPFRQRPRQLEPGNGGYRYRGHERAPAPGRRCRLILARACTAGMGRSSPDRSGGHERVGRARNDRAEGPGFLGWRAGENSFRNGLQDRRSRLHALSGCGGCGSPLPAVRYQSEDQVFCF